MLEQRTNPGGPVTPPRVPTRESVALKRTGIALALAGGGLWMYVDSLAESTPGDAWTLLQARYAAGTWSLVGFVAIAAIGVAVGAAGVLVTITGARKLSLANPSTRKGLFVMWIGAMCTILALFAGTVVQGRNDVFVEWADLPPVLAWVLLGVGILLVRTGWKYDVKRAADVVASDPRAPVVYLRSFQDDVKSPVGGVLGMWLKIPMWFFPVSFEQELAGIMNRLGPFVAVGRPGERLPELGANRFYFSNEEWQARVSELVRGAQLTLVLCGPTPSLWWEIDHVLTSASPRRVVLLIPERGKHTLALEQQLEERLACPGVLRGDGRRRRSMIATLCLGPDKTIGKLVYFEDDWTPRVQVIRHHYEIRAYLRMLARPYSLYGEPLESAFELVFARLGLPWRQAGPSRLIAIVLAVTMGAFGVHHFYLGDRRRGLKYLLFVWTFVPLFLGLRDAARLVLIDRDQFERTYDQR